MWKCLCEQNFKFFLTHPNKEPGFRFHLKQVQQFSNYIIISDSFAGNRVKIKLNYIKHSCNLKFVTI